MSNPVIFDTHRYVQQLTQAGLDPSVAQLIGDREAEKSERSLATKDDLAKEFRNLDLKIADMKSDLYKFITIALTAHGAMILGVVAALIKL